jgi:hypothetical protein
VRPTVSGARRRRAAGGGAWEVNKPAGLTLFTDTTFGNLLTGGAYNADNVAIVNDSNNVQWVNSTDNAAPYGPSVTDIAMDAGSLTGNGTIFYSSGARDWKRTYWCWSLWLSPNYSMHSNGEKFWYPIIKQQDGANPSLSDTQLSNPFIQWKPLDGMTPSGSEIGWIYGNQMGGGDFQQFDQPLGNLGRLRKGQWMIIEGYTQMNTPGNADGIVRTWVDGQVCLDVTNARLAPAAATGSNYINGVRFTTTRGGGDSSEAIPSGGQVRRYDRLSFYASTSF